MRTVYLGTSQFAAVVLERLAAGEHRPSLVVSRPDRPRGRGRKLAPPPVAEAARALELPLAQPESVNAGEASERIAAERPDALCVCAFGALIREPLLSSYEMLNVHPSLLPRWRGAAPVERAIEAGDELTGVSIMRPTAEVDAGPVFVARSEPIHAGDDYGSLAGRLARLGAELLIEALDERPAPRPQPEEGVVYAEKIGAADRRLESQRSPAELERHVRALHPHVGADVELSGSESGAGERLGVCAARVAGGGREVPPGSLRATDGRLLYGCLGGGVLELTRVKPAGGREMDADSYLRGHAHQLAEAG